MTKRVLLKLTSWKNLLTLWAVVLITFIVLGNKVDFNNVAMLLTSIPLIYFPINVFQKRGENGNN